MSIAVASGQMLVLPTDFFSRIYIFIHSELASLFLYTTSLWSIKISFCYSFVDWVIEAEDSGSYSGVPWALQPRLNLFA